MGGVVTDAPARPRTSPSTRVGVHNGDGSPRARRKSRPEAVGRAWSVPTRGAAARRRSHSGDTRSARQHSATVKSACVRGKSKKTSLLGLREEGQRLFLGCRAPSATHDSLCGAALALALGHRQTGAPLGASASPRLTHSPGAPSRSDRRRGAAAPHGLALVQHQADGTGFELVK